MFKIEIGDGQSLDSIIRQMNEIEFQLLIDDWSLFDLIIDFNWTSFLRPYKLAVVSAFVETLRTKYDVRVMCININHRNKGYISRMDFFEEMGCNYDEDFTRHDATGKFIPINRVTEENRYNLPTELVKIIKYQWVGIHKDIVSTLDWTIYEIIDNMFNHSESKIDGFVTAQYYPTKNEIDLSFIDCGIGIANRLRQNQQYCEITTPQALELAIQKGVTVNQITNAGAGLYYTKRVIEENEGNIWIHSGDAQLRATGYSTEIDKSHYWSGTIIRLIIKTNNLIDPNVVFDNNLPPTVMDHDDDNDNFLW